jgi:hypothetical protein
LAIVSDHKTRSATVETAEANTGLIVVYGVDYRKLLFESYEGRLSRKVAFLQRSLQGTSEKVAMSLAKVSHEVSVQSDHIVFEEGQVDQHGSMWITIVVTGHCRLLKTLIEDKQKAGSKERCGGGGGASGGGPGNRERGKGRKGVGRRGDNSAVADGASDCARTDADAAAAGTSGNAATAASAAAATAGGAKLKITAAPPAAPSASPRRAITFATPSSPRPVAPPSPSFPASSSSFSFSSSSRKPMTLALSSAVGTRVGTSGGGEEEGRRRQVLFKTVGPGAVLQDTATTTRCVGSPRLLLPWAFTCQSMTATKVRKRGAVYNRSYTILIHSV